ncbi:hypothetical protein [Romboutsia sp.]|uniref:hypothetical protein n=1 Tax=Romboutsia sp. TaxID=1965302 RepID=UPI002CC0814B|nr:hypothetical protein [Romboutsia sp.]HSQ88861.1 hypothetical protein [Romboutsia sp.]
MSKFLAPIHTWLFNKIKLAQDLEENIVKLHIDNYNEEALKVQKQAISLYGNYIEDKPLENLIDVDNIHGWLQERIKEVESRSAYIITKYYDMYKQESKTITQSAYVNQAKECVKNENNKIDSPENVYISLNNYILSGMPCDRANSVTQRNEDYLVYEQHGCIHKANYELGKANLEYMYELRDLWVKTFIENLSTKYIYEKEKNEGVAINKIRKG